MIIHPGIIGIDVSKAHFDIFDAERGRPERLPNSSEVARALAERLANRPNGFAIFEATGTYDRHLRDAFDDGDIPYARVNPQRPVTLPAPADAGPRPMRSTREC